MAGHTPMSTMSGAGGASKGAAGLQSFTQVFKQARQSLGLDEGVNFNAISTPFQRHFNAILTPFQRHFNAISTPFQRRSTLIFNAD